MKNKEQRAGRRRKNKEQVAGNKETLLSAPCYLDKE
jgi:hypothetical protein